MKQTPQNSLIKTNPTKKITFTKNKKNSSTKKHKKLLKKKQN